MKRTWMHSSAFMLTLLGLACSTNSVRAQDDPPQGEVQTTQSVEMTVIGDGLSAPMIFSTNSTDGGVTRMGVFAGSDLFVNGEANGDFGMPAPDPFAMLSNPSVQKDIELVGDQLKKVQELQSNFAQRMKDEIGDLSKGGLGADRFKGIPDLMKRLREEQQTEMESLLLPHQIDRLKQVALQTHMKRAGAASALVSEALANELGITDAQKEKLKARAEEIKVKLAEEMAKLKEQAQEDLLSVLDATQRAKLKEMTGDKFESRDEDWKSKIQPRYERRQTRRNSNAKQN